MTYDWEQDAFGSWRYAWHMMRLKNGLRRFETIREMYRVERWGEVP